MIGDKLKKLREEKDLLQKDMAKYLNITTSAYGYYEQEKRKPDIEMIKKLADFFNVSTDYLLGRTENKRNCKKYNINLYNNKEDEKFMKIRVDEDIIIKNEPVLKDIFENLLNHGKSVTVEILKSEE